MNREQRQIWDTLKPTKHREITNPRSATGKLNTAKHTHGRRHVQRFAPDYQLDRLRDHVTSENGLTAQLRRALRLGRHEKVALLTDLINRTMANAQTIATKLAVANNGPITRHIGYRQDTVTGKWVRAKVFLGTMPERPTGRTVSRFSQDIVNHGVKFRLRKD